MTRKTISDDLLMTMSACTFVYKGERCGIDPFSDHDFSLWYGGRNVKVGSLEELFSKPFFDGRTLSDVLGEIEDYEAG